MVERTAHRTAAAKESYGRRLGRRTCPSVLEEASIRYVCSEGSGKKCRSAPERVGERPDDYLNHYSCHIDFGSQSTRIREAHLWLQG
ncbi:hypothetical protein BHE74_00019046 [Ensete ventricosum]|nr:hypothetical protein GW17_00025869 [Ensete ventricosum]RWW73104.1 hypothetical protein BHE74_00019046 [Ensete ventricosum]